MRWIVRHSRDLNHDLEMSEGPALDTLKKFLVGNIHELLDARGYDFALCPASGFEKQCK